MVLVYHLRGVKPACTRGTRSVCLLLPPASKLVQTKMGQEKIVAEYHYDSGEQHPISANAEKAKKVKAHMYSVMITQGMSAEEAQHFCDTMPQCLIDTADLEALSSPSLAGPTSLPSEGDETEPEGPRVDVSSFTLMASDGSKLYKYRDASGSSSSADELGSNTTVHVAGDGTEAPSLVFSWNGEKQFELLLRGKAISKGIGAGELRIALNGEIPIVADSLDGGVLDQACLKSEECKVVLGGRWTDSDAQEALSALYK